MRATEWVLGSYAGVLHVCGVRSNTTVGQEAVSDLYRQRWVVNAASFDAVSTVLSGRSASCRHCAVCCLVRALRMRLGSSSFLEQGHGKRHYMPFSQPSAEYIGVCGTFSETHPDVPSRLQVLGARILTPMTWARAATSTTPTENADPLQDTKVARLVHTRVHARPRGPCRNHKVRPKTSKSRMPNQPACY